MDSGISHLRVEFDLVREAEGGGDRVKGHSRNQHRDRWGLLSPALWGYHLPVGQNTFPAPRRPVPAGDCLLSPREMKKNGDE